jgi:hypothetical protein
MTPAGKKGPMKSTFTRAELIQVSTAIAQGMLASGHYTEPDLNDGEDAYGESGPEVRYWKADKDWKECGFHTPYPTFVASEAVQLAKELLLQVDEVMEFEARYAER